ncbi:hypothetical protein HOLleu_23262 [Holothuria leucospilota]|uniref:Uncharacterized protein n=1 Tax=Holothuria leucospilota TaxID=206669 RepID=A0A9Q1H5E9_HOLLE|nr:hypothetical protein HOLleu_23262 [Holothuria leucospilota]
MEYFGVEQTNMCYCGRSGTEYNRYGPSIYCNTPCTGNITQICGGQFAVDIYKTGVLSCPRLNSPRFGHVNVTEDTALFDCKNGYRLLGPKIIHCNRSTGNWTDRTDPTCYKINGSRSNHTLTEFQHLGCFKDIANDNLRVLNGHGKFISQLTLDLCLFECSVHGMYYFGVEEQSMCFCGESDSNYKIYGPSTGCISPCPGNNNQICGGYLAIEVFLTGISPCVPLRPPFNGMVFQTAEMAHFECLDGYQLQGSEQIYCDILTKKWDGPTYSICLAKTDDEDENVGIVTTEVALSDVFKGVPSMQYFLEGGTYTDLWIVALMNQNSVPFTAVSSD